MGCLAVVPHALHIVHFITVNRHSTNPIQLSLPCAIYPYRTLRTALVTCIERQLTKKNKTKIEMHVNSETKKSTLYNFFLYLCTYGVVNYFLISATRKHRKQKCNVCGTIDRPCTCSMYQISMRKGIYALHTLI